METKLHSVQTKILMYLLFHPVARYSELNVTKMTTDHFNFHIKRMIESGLVTKNASGRYKLTKKGKEFANRFDTDDASIEKQPKVAVLVFCIKDDEKDKEYLVQQRLKQPYFGYYGLISGKVRWGETVEEAAKRELKEETKLEGKPIFVGIEHKMDYSKEKELLEDKLFFIYKVTNPKGKLMKDFKGGKNKWIKESEYKRLPNRFSDMGLLEKIVNSDKFEFIENKASENKY